MLELIRQRFAESVEAARACDVRLADRLCEAARVILTAYRDGGGVYLFGNGGSAADAQHVAGELVGRFLRDRRALKAAALTTDTSVLTCLSNDFSYESIFARQLEALGEPGDVAVGLTTSGNSPNVVVGLRRARELGMRTIAFTGPGGGACRPLADVLLDVPAARTPEVQQCHVILYHVLCELVESGVVEAEKYPRRPSPAGPA